MSAGPERPVGRILAAVAVFGAIAYLIVKVGIRLIGEEPVPVWEAPISEAGQEIPVSDATPRVVVRGVETQKTEIVVDGEVFFSDSLRGGEALEPPAGRRVEVALPDLTRAVVIYNGTRVGPLGKLNAGRRLVFIDDSN